MRRLTVSLAAVAVGATLLSAPGLSSASPRPAVLGSKLSQWEQSRPIEYGPKSTGCSRKYPCFRAPTHNREDGHTYQFTSLDVDGGIVDGMDEVFADNTGIAAAEAAVMAMMPADAVAGPLVVDDNNGSCALMTVTSPTLGTELGSPKIGDTQGVLGVEFSYDDSNFDIVYNPKNVEDATVSLAPLNPADNC